MTRFFAMRSRVSPPRSRGAPAEALSRELVHEPAQLEREQGLERRTGRHARVADDLVDVAAGVADGPEGGGKWNCRGGAPHGNSERSAPLRTIASARPAFQRG